MFSAYPLHIRVESNDVSQVRQAYASKLITKLIVNAVTLMYLLVFYSINRSGLEVTWK